ncbi:MAG: cobaltochelatase subunit CobN [Alphaproteobacteria bacterium]
MHLLAAEPGVISDGAGAIDLGQSPGDIVVLSAADSEIACLAQAHRAATDPSRGPVPRLRLANILKLAHNLSVDLYVDSVIAPEAKLVIVRLLGGRSYWSYGVDQLAAFARERGTLLALVPGDDQPDAELSALSTIPAEALHRLWQYFVHGGVENAVNFLHYAASLIGIAPATPWQEPAPLLRAGLYWPGVPRPSMFDLEKIWQANAPRTAVLFYRALVQAADTAPIDALIAGLQNRGLNPVPIYCTSLKDGLAAAIVSELIEHANPEIILSATGFAQNNLDQAPGNADESPLGADCPVIQIVLAGGTEAEWRAGTRGLSARDIAMNVALPEVDGRIIGRAVSFKDRLRRDDSCECDIIAHRPVPDRIAFVADLAASWVRLRRTPEQDRRVALVLANYPNRDGRIGNGVGLDTPKSAIVVLEALAKSGFDIRAIPEDGDALVRRLIAGPTNDHRRNRSVTEILPLGEYQAFFAALPDDAKGSVDTRWGAPETDPFFDSAGGGFAIPAFRCGNVAVGLQPARGYNVDPMRSYHDPALVPPHGYFAFYAWLKLNFGAQAIVHLGKHGTLEWLPGKALALSRSCFPEAVLGAVPHLYPFIVNDPGEGTQAKRRAQAVIVDHLTPPLTRAESYGPLRDLEQLVDEYYEAAAVDPRRLKVLTRAILDLAESAGIAVDCGIERRDDESSALKKLDAYLCELKELQIRDGLHVFGESPVGMQLADLLVALVRVPRGRGDGGDASLTRALADDLGLGFDPLDCALGEEWQGAMPQHLTDVLPDAWRSFGDAVERLEVLAQRLVLGETPCRPEWTRTKAVLDTVEQIIRPLVSACGAHELDGLLRGLSGRFVPPGPSGAPTRGRSDVLPTGRNFYSVDTRTVPTPAAWRLGWDSAGKLVARYAQEHGEFPRRLALSAWGTSNMRTGGDDIAQGLALMGVRPTWDSASRRVTGFEILPLSVLDRPRVDVTLRISGFFRDAFPGLIDLFDSAARAVAALDERGDLNPLAARAHEDTQKLIAAGLDESSARHRAGFRVFGSKPGAYGAGLQALIDERGWEGDADLAKAYVAWGGYAYGAGAQGEAQHQLFERRLALVQAVVHNQDNREHDLLDSDDYYQFEGGLAVAVKQASGSAPAVYHADHSRPESPRILRLEEEIARVVRSRVVNPKWIAGVMRHGYKGGFEMAATVDYMFAFAATTHVVRDHHFDAVFDAYIDDDLVRGFLETHNPDALREMSERLLEAEHRGLWRPRRNSAHEKLSAIATQRQRQAS